MRGSLMRVAIIVGWLAWLLPAVLVRAEADLSASRVAQVGLPLPPGITPLAQGTTVEVGATALDVDSFVSAMEVQRLVEYYHKALPNAGWRVELLPWQQQHEQATKRLEKAVKKHRKAPEAAQSKLKQLSEEFHQTAKDMQRQIFATRGSEHVIVNLWPSEKGTVVFLNHWSGNRFWMESPLGQGGQRRAPAAGGWLQENVCCSGEAVPGLSGEVLPMSVPRYPDAKAIARSTPAGGGRSTVLLKTPDAAAAVADFYRTEMPATGWKLIKEESGVLTFQKPDRLCTLTIQGPDPSAQEPGETLVTVSTELRASLQGSRQP